MRKVCAGLLAAGSGMWLTGCGGMSASHSVSPASFLLPGLLRVEPPRPAPAAGQPAPPEVASVFPHRNS
ncbi:MAG: hypothetical protein ACKO3N_01455 [Verrucomicrobiota bacterium]